MNAPAKVFPPYEIINPDSLKARVRIHANDLRWQCAQFDLIDERHAWKRRDEKKLSEEEKELIRSRAVFPLSHLLERAQAFELEASADSGITLSAEISSFLKDLRSRREALIALAQKAREEGSLPFELIPSAYLEGEAVCVDLPDARHGALVESAEIEQTFYGPFAVIKYKFCAFDGKKFVWMRHSRRIPAYEGERSGKQLGLWPLSAAEKTQFLAEGKRYAQHTKTPSYLHYTGALRIRGYWQDRLLRAHGRCMSDLRALKEMLPSFDGFYGSPLRENDEEADGADMERDENQLFASPYVYGFSFYAKTWGEMVFAQMKPIAFRKDAFEKLVLDDESKRLVDALVRQTISGEPGSGDLIDGKGGGAIFLLHGSPGVGKTLTAEAIAERQERPLYMVGAGELGVSPEELEERLQKILEVAFAWRAVLLIDEADIFMERRSRDDVTRNAMVGIFLRLLEYHQGILFLTTNRVEDIDSAFLSRISIGLRYAPHEEEARAQIWKNLLEGNKALGSLDGRAAGKLARHNINGRQIKHCIRLACALAAAEQRPAQIEDLEMMVSIAEKFRKDFQAGQKESANG